MTTTATFTPVLSRRGYQGCGLSGKTLATATGLAVETYGYQETGLSGKTGATETGLGSRGYQEFGLSGKAGGDATGLSTTTQYYFKVNINGAGVAEYDITTAADVTFTAVIALMNAAVTGATFGLSGGDLRCTSSKYGTTSAIALSAGTTGTDLAGALTGFTAYDTAVAGAGGHYYFKVDVDGAGAVEYDITTTTDNTFTGVIALMNTAVGTDCTVSLTGGDMRVTSPTNGALSSIDLAAGTTGTDLFATLTGFSSFDTAVAGVTSSYYLKISKNHGTLTEVSIAVLDDATFGGVIDLLNAKMTGALAGCAWSLSKAGDLVCRSPDGGEYSAIGLAAGASGTDFFVTLTGWAGFSSPVVGTPYKDVTEKYIIYYGSLVASGPDHVYATGGLTTSFAGIGPHAVPPTWVEVRSQGPSDSSTLAGVYTFVPGTDITNGVTLISIANKSASGVQALQEMTDTLALNDSSVYINLDRIVFKAYFQKGK